MLQMDSELSEMALSQNNQRRFSFLALRFHNNLTAAVITAHRSEVSSFI